MGNSLKQNIINYFLTWKNRDYEKGIPDEVPEELYRLNLAPSYKGIGFAILKNDITLKSLGMNVKKSKYYNIYKKIELDERKNGKKI